MSAFIVDKVQYMKVAGMLAYYMTHEQAGHECLIHSLKTKADIYQDFENLYLNNVASVNGRYQDDYSFADKNEYLDEFGQAYEDAKSIHSDRSAEEQLFAKLSNWFDMVSYQSDCIEETYNRFNEISNPYQISCMKYYINKFSGVEKSFDDFDYSDIMPKEKHSYIDMDFFSGIGGAGGLKNKAITDLKKELAETKAEKSKDEGR